MVGGSGSLGGPSAASGFGHRASGIGHRPSLIPSPIVPDLAAPTPVLDRRSVIIYVSGTVLLIVFNYWALPSWFAGTTFPDRIIGWLGEGSAEYRELLGFQYWGVASIVLRVLIPLALILFVLRERPRDFGYRLRGQWPQLRPYLIAMGVMVPVLFLASGLSTFQAKYPLYDSAVLGGWHFWGYHLFYGLQFLGLEAFFRGYLLFGLYPRLGNHAIAVMMIPYVMVHFGKPAPETFSAIVAGFVLGYLALKSKSFLWGWMLHWGVAITMDIMVIGREFGFGAITDVLF